MTVKSKTAITVESTVHAPVEKVWEFWTGPEHIKKWCYASEDWHAPDAENDVKTGGKFRTTMAAKDGSMSFDFEGIYTKVEKLKHIEYAMSDGRNVKVEFINNGDSVKVVETFDPEDTNPHEMQRGGWQAILDNFKKYTEEN